jgi:hypothetical protein
MEWLRFMARPEPIQVSMSVIWDWYPSSDPVVTFSPPKFDYSLSLCSLSRRKYSALYFSSE